MPIINVIIYFTVGVNLNLSLLYIKLKNDDDDDHHHKIGYFKAYTFKILSYFTSDKEKEAVEWLYPNSVYDPIIPLTSVILASTNVAVDKWNTIIQDLNPANSRIFKSKDSFEELDDEEGKLNSMLSEETLNSYNSNGVPKHILKLKVNDVCLVVRAIASLKLASNTRVQLISFNLNTVRVKTLNEPKTRYLNLFRIIFKFRLHYGQSFQLTRLQIPLRLAYSMTYNKSQSQSIPKLLIDITEQPFAHGHAYVALSRATNSLDVRIYCNENQLHETCDKNSINEYMPVITNIVYTDILF